MKKTAISIVKTLKKAGHQAYFAGGSVRDMLMGKLPCDFDIVTSAKPEEIEKLLEKTIPIGKKFGVILAILNGHHFEVATFRSDASYSDGRRPDAVYFSNPKEDAIRRDFTINGIFYDPIKKEIIDYVSGQRDLKRKVIRFIGNPDERIKEDNLRIMRAVRFKNALNFKYEPKTKAAIKKNNNLILNVSWERIRDELNKILELRKRAEAFRDLSEMGVLKYILPEIETQKGVAQPHIFHQEGDVLSHSLKSIKSLPSNVNLTLIWATLLHDVGKPQTFKIAERIRFDGHVQKSTEIAKDVLKRLRFSKKEIEDIAWLIKNHMILTDIPKMRKAKRIRIFHDRRFGLLLELHKADALGTKPSNLDLYKKIKKMWQEELKRPLPPKSLLSGHEIMAKFKIKSGPEVGKLLKIVREAQLEGKIKNKKQAFNYLKRMS